MKKLKLLTSLSTIGLVAATVPVVATSCGSSVQGTTFDNTYTVNDITENWLKDKIGTWSSGGDYSSYAPNYSKATSYVKDNLSSSSKYANLMIYSIAKSISSYPIVENDNADITQFRIQDSLLNYDKDAKQLAYDFKVMDKTGNYGFRVTANYALSVISASQTDNNKWISLGTGYGAPYISYGVSVATYENGEWGVWQAIDNFNRDTNKYALGTCKLQIPNSIVPNQTKFASEDVSLKLLDSTKKEITSRTVLLQKGEIAIYSLALCVGEIYVLPDEKYTVKINDPNWVHAGCSSTYLLIDLLGNGTPSEQDKQITISTNLALAKTPPSITIIVDEAQE